MNFSDMTDEEFAEYGRAYAAEKRARKAANTLFGIDVRRFKGKQHNNTSGHRGVTFNKNAQKWQAKIGVGGNKVKHLGYFKTAELAASARATAEVEYWGKKA